MDQRVIIVLGMHRSGTSALTGSLEEAGVHLGPVARAHNDSLKGWCENPAVYTMHERLFQLNGGSWYSPPEVCLWSRSFEVERDAIIDGFRDRPLWGFKDPRTLFTLDGWLKVLPYAEPVGIFRNPRLVADSLSRRNALSYEASIRMWLNYNLKLLYWYRQVRFPIISFDDEELSFEDQMRGLVTFMRLQRVCKFTYYESRFRHVQNASQDILPPDAHRVYQLLKTVQKETISRIGPCRVEVKV